MKAQTLRVAIWAAVLLVVAARSVLAAAPEGDYREWGTQRTTGWDRLSAGPVQEHHYGSMNVDCPLCDATFLVGDLGTYSTYGRDLDFKVNESTADTLVFALWMCPQCNYCTWAHQFDDPLDEDYAVRVRAALTGTTAYPSYFDIPYSDLMRRADQCFGAREEWSTEDRMWFYLYGAWVARDSREPEVERAFHSRCREFAERLVEEGEGDTRAAAAYLVAEIERRYGDPDRALELLDRAALVAEEVGSGNIPTWIQACREQIEADRGDGSTD